MSSFPRYPRVRSQWREFVTPAIRNLVLACVGVFLIQTLLYLFNPAAYGLMNREFGLVPFDFLFKLHLWQPVTYIFLHGRLWLMPFPSTIPMKIYVIGAGAIEFFLTLGSGAGDNVSHVTHLGGMLVGYLYLRRGSWFYRARNGVSDWQRRRARRKFEVYMRRH